MLLKSEFAQAIYWRTFKHNDLLHFAGLSDGVLLTNQQLDLRENDVSFQLEIKVGTTFASPVVLLAAALGQQFHDTDAGVIVRSTGKVDIL